MVLNKFVGHRIRSGDARPARIVIMKFPRRELAFRVDAALDVNHSSRTEVRPSKFLLARPYDFNRMACRPGEARRFESRVSRVLASVR